MVLLDIQLYRNLDSKLPDLHQYLHCLSQQLNGLAALFSCFLQVLILRQEGLSRSSRVRKEGEDSDTREQRQRDHRHLRCHAKLSIYLLIDARLQVEAASKRLSL